MAGLEDKYYAQAERLYVRGMPSPEDPEATIYPTLEQIAAVLGPGGPAVTTLSRWSKKGDWPGLRQRWRAVNQDLPTRLLAAAERRLNYLEERPEDAKADELFKLRSIFAAVRAEMAGGDEDQVDRLAVFLEVLRDLTDWLKELEPEGVGLLYRHYDELISRARRNYA